MCFTIETNELDLSKENHSIEEGRREHAACSIGRHFTCFIHTQKMTFLCSLIILVALLIMSGFVASGMFGNGHMFFIASGLVVSAILFGMLTLFLQKD